MYYAKNFSLVFMLISLSYCQTGKEQEEELTAEMMRAGAGAAAEPTVRLQSSDDQIFVVPLRIARKSQTIATMLDDSGVVADDSPIPLPSVTQEGLTLILRLLGEEAITQDRLGSVLGDLQVPANRTRALQLLNASDYLDIGDLLQQTAIYLGSRFTIAVINSWHEIPPDLVDMIIRLKRVAKAVSASHHQNCVIRTDDTLQCWPLGLYSDVLSGPVKAVSVGTDYTCVIKMDDRVQCTKWWGVADLEHVKAVSVGYNHNCAIKRDDRVQCWGVDSYGKSTIPADLGPVKAVSAGGEHTCAIKMDDTVQCWGYNQDGQTTIPPDLGNVKAVSAGGEHNCAIKTNDTVQCWGSNVRGQRDVPPNLGTVKAINSGRSWHTCAIKTDDTVRCWGYDDHGQATVPEGLGEVRAVSAGNNHNCAIKMNDTVHCWGDNSLGHSTVPADLRRP